MLFVGVTEGDPAGDFAAFHRDESRDDIPEAVVSVLGPAISVKKAPRKRDRVTS